MEKTLETGIRKYVFMDPSKGSPDFMLDKIRIVAKMSKIKNSTSQNDIYSDWNEIQSKMKSKNCSMSFCLKGRRR